MLALVAVITHFLQKGYEQDGWFWMLAAELLIFAAVIYASLSQQTGRLKPGPDKGRVTYRQLAEQDSLVQVYIGLYVFLLMVAVVARVLLVGAIEDVSVGPWGVFVALAPIFVIVSWRTYKLEAVCDQPEY